MFPSEHSWRAALLFIVVSALTPAPTWAAPTLAEAVDAARAGRCRGIALTALDPTIESALAGAHLTRCALDDGEWESAIAWAERTASAANRANIDLALTLDWYEELEARIALLNGQPQDAVRAFEDLIASEDVHPASRGMRARRQYYLSLALAASGRAVEASTRQHALIEEYPASEPTSRLAPQFVEKSWSVSLALECGERALDARHYASAETLYRLAACAGEDCSPLEAVSAGGARYRAAYQLGWFLYRFRRELVADALPWLETVASRPGSHRADAAHAYALAVERLQRFAESRRAWRDFSEQFRGDERASAALSRIAWTYVEERNYGAAADSWSRVLNANLPNADSSEARWWLGWSLLRGESCSAALNAWRGVGGGRARAVTYWSAVCHDELGERERAELMWHSLRDENPLNWYGLWASRRLGVALVPSLNAVPRAATPPAHLPRAANEASQRGLVAESTLLAGEISEPFSRLAARADVSDFVRWRGAVDLSELPTSVSSLQAWRLALPPMYRQTVDAQAALNGLDSPVIWALMEKESSFRRHALSRSDAMGLMQVIPQTAIAIADRLDEPYVDGMLFEPHHAVRYGAWYLGALLRSFDGQLPVAIAAYNAGP
ncbi:MAG: hypothetical protein ACJA1R_002294, partial [Flavobacteriales bacterium]